MEDHFSFLVLFFLFLFQVHMLNVNFTNGLLSWWLNLVAPKSAQQSAEQAAAPPMNGALHLERAWAN